MRFAPVAPIHILEELYKRDPKYLYGNYHLFLAHHTMEHVQRFNDLVMRDHTDHPFGRGVIIMDNSIVECGNAVDDELVHEATQAVLTDNQDRIVIPVLPDVMGNGPDTVEASNDGYHRWEANGMPGHGYMLVAQGKDLEEFRETVNFFFIERREDFPKINWVGIPRKLCDLVGSRKEAIRYVQAVAPHVKIHLLGFSENMVDDIVCAKHFGVQGIDSAVPVRHPGVLTPTSQTFPRPTEWMEKGVLTYEQCQNIQRVRMWIS